MTKICTRCGCTMPYDPYFKSYVCRQCGTSIPVPVKAQATISPSGNDINSNSKRYSGIFGKNKIIMCK